MIWRQKIRAAVYRSYILAIRLAERLLGPRAVSLPLFPIIAGDFLRRLPDFTQFHRLREFLPPTLREQPALRHYFRMIRIWHESLAVTILFDRLDSPAWTRRIRESGPAPDQLPEWNQRPVIVIFLHAGGYALLRSRLRSRGIPAALQVRALPEISFQAHRIRKAGNARYGMSDIPEILMGGNAARNALKFLIPGHALLVALDPGWDEPLTRYDVGGIALHLQDGAVRLARHTRAILLPASVHRTGPLQFDIRYGTPVPDSLLQTDDTAPAMQHLVEELWPQLERDPDAIGWHTLEALNPVRAKIRTTWP